MILWKDISKRIKNQQTTKCMENTQHVEIKHNCGRLNVCDFVCGTKSSLHW